MASVEGSGFQIGMVGSLALSVASSVSIVICNKALMSSLGFPYATTLTSWHLMVTFCTLHVAQRFHLFEPKLIDAKTVVLFGILNGTSIGFLNLCLGFNSVGFYQMTKLAIIPFTVLLETIFLKKKFSKSIKFSLLVLLFGVGIASVTDLNLNLVGSILSFLAIATTCVGQIMTNTIQKRLKVSSTQLLYQSSPFQAAILFATGPSVDRLLTKRSVFAYNYSFMVLVCWLINISRIPTLTHYLGFLSLPCSTSKKMLTRCVKFFLKVFIVLSCLIAVSVNFSTFLVIGTTSPVTYQVLGHVKTCLILSFGYIILHDPFTARNIMGILTAVFGMGLYSYFSVQESKKKSANDSLPISQMAQKETVPLLASKNQDKDHNETKRSNGIPAASKDSFE
ncbi:UDP-xylose transporter 1-like isoform X1 [Zingiber officinale]|uniref:UDP-xylose transporter 1-like isoform X1 n=1 Tax=Zingiber officinale TaxID=94328 RepID=UPI001C4AA599|nr:UDP-xylose transporter 1-like isoform X1 [Zingiber officinale]